MVKKMTLEEKIKKLYSNKSLKKDTWGIYQDEDELKPAKLVMLTQNAHEDDILYYWDTTRRFYLHNLLMDLDSPWGWPAMHYEFDPIFELSKLPTKAELTFAQMMHPAITDRMIRDVLISTFTINMIAKIKRALTCLGKIITGKGGK